MPANATMNALEIGPARRSEAALARRMVPQLFTAETAPDTLLVACAMDHSHPIGVCAIAWRFWGTPSGFPLHVHVAQRARRKGVGRALVRAAAGWCRDNT